MSNEEKPSNGRSEKPISNPEGENGNGRSDDEEKNSNGLQAFETLRAFLEEDGWYPQQIGDRNVYRVFFSGNNGDLRCYAKIDVKLQIFIFYAFAPIKVPEEMRPIVAEYVTRANYGLRIGNFELDYRDGEVRYKSSLDFEGDTLTPSLIRNATYAAVQTMDNYLDGLMHVTFGTKIPEQAIKDIEN